MKGRIGSGFALAWIAALGLIIAAFFGIDAWMGKPTSVPPPKPEAAVTSQVTETDPSALDNPTVFVPPPRRTTPTPFLSQGSVTVLDLDHLASAVHLREPGMGASKQVWAGQLPIAQSLLQRSCDCDQRNWLTHYVKTANEALSGSEDYAHSIQLLATLRRCDQDLTYSDRTAH